MQQKCKPKSESQIAGHGKLSHERRDRNSSTILSSAMKSLDLEVPKLHEPMSFIERQGHRLKARHGFLACSHLTRMAARKALASDPHV